MSDTKHKHTPGPWTITERSPGHLCGGLHAIECLIRVGDGNALAIVSLGGPGAISSNPDMIRANARLIAAAPEMLDALFNIISKLETDATITRRDMEPARSAIFKALGSGEES